MRIAIFSEVFSKQMGYAENCLPKALAEAGHQVHLITSRLPPYYNLAGFKGKCPGGYPNGGPETDSEKYQGYTVHYLPHRHILGYLRLRGMGPLLRRIKPDIVQTFSAISWIPLELAWLRSCLGYALFTGSHNTASTFALARRNLPSWHWESIKSFLTRFVPGRLIGRSTERCYAVTVDAARIASDFFGVPREKVTVMHLGVDGKIFYPPVGRKGREERRGLRKRLGLRTHDIVCIYTGKFTEEKNPALLARAVAQLRMRGLPYRGLFIGDGIQKPQLGDVEGSTVLGTMPFRELGPYYRASDIGVWLTNESTSMLDAAACGLPLIVSDGIVYRDHVEGNGLIYRMNDLDSLMECLVQLGDPARRRILGDAGARKMRQHFGWELVARKRLADYAMALDGRRSRTPPDGAQGT